MPKPRRSIIASAILATLITAPALASAFIGGIVDTSAGTPPLSPLNVRTQPKPSAPLWMSLPHTSNVSLTGPCRRYNSSYSAVLSSFNVKNLSKAVAQPKMQRPRTWCQVWVEKPAGAFSARWVNANFVML